MSLVFTGAAEERRAEIRKADDGYSLFTWSDFGGNIGIILWRERHGQEYGQAFCAARDWLQNPQLPELNRSSEK